MLVNGASKSFVHNQKRTEGSVRSDQSAHVGHSILERAAEALYEFVFSGCDRLDGKHRWADCDEETKEGFGVRQVPYLTPSGHSCSFVRSNHQKSIEGQIRAATLLPATRAGEPARG